jgi:hypothetical protein
MIPRSPQKSPPTVQPLQPTTTEEWEDFLVTFTEWGALGIVMQEQRPGEAHVLSATDEAMSLGVQIGAILLRCNDHDCTKMPYKDQVDFLANADWPKRLDFKIKKGLVVPRAPPKKWQQNKKQRTYEVIFPQQSSDQLGMDFVPTPRGLLVSVVTEPASTCGVRVGSTLISVNDVKVSEKSNKEVTQMVAAAAWPKKLVFGERMIN